MTVDQAYAEGLQALGRLDTQTALERFTYASRLEPTDPDAWYQLALAQSQANDLQSAKNTLRQALNLNPGHAHALAVLGGVQCCLAEWEDALITLNRALYISPNMPSARWNRGTANLGLGNYLEGWEDNEFGFVNTLRKPRHPFKHWDGQSKVNRLLLWGEQGFGDIVQFARFASLGSKFAKTTYLEVRKEMLRLFQAQDYGCEIVCQPADFSTSVEFDAHCSISSLPYYLGLGRDQCKSAPYIKAPGLRQFGLEGKRKIGLVWAGNPGHANDHNRSIPAAAMMPLLQADATFYSFQKDQQVTDQPKLNPLGTHFADWSDTADALEELDLLITADTGIAHLAGAMGKEVWMLIPYAPDWRWGKDEVQSHWYPSIRIFRQESAGDWAGVVERVLKELQ